MWTEEEIKGKILHKLTRLGKFKHSYTSVDNLPKGFSKELRGEVKDNIEELIKEKVLFKKPTNYGVEVSINSDMKERIMYYIEKFLDKE